MNVRPHFLSITLGLTACLLSSCSLDSSYIREHTWKYGEGYWPHQDILVFGGGFLSLKHDTIFIADSAIAVVSATEKGYFGKDNEIQIQSLASGEKGSYHEFGLVKAEDTTIEILLTPPPPTEAPPPPPAP